MVVRRISTRFGGFALIISILRGTPALTVLQWSCALAVECAPNTARLILLPQRRWTKTSHLAKQSRIGLRGSPFKPARRAVALFSRRLGYPQDPAVPGENQQRREFDCDAAWLSGRRNNGASI